MNKVFCNRETNMVEQIICIDIDKRFDESWYPHCYIIDDEDNEVQGYNLKYNIETEQFDIVEGIEARPETEFEKSVVEELQEQINLLQVMTIPTNEMDALRQENKELKDELDIIKRHLGIL